MFTKQITIVIVWVIYSHSQKFPKIGFLKIFAKFTGKQLCWSLFLINFATCYFFKKETPVQKFSCEYFKTFKNNIFTGRLGSTASVFMEHIWNIVVDTWSESQLLCFIILKSMSSDVLILVIWPSECTNICKRLQKTYSAGKNII